jgi:hypothetical protein
MNVPRTFLSADYYAGQLFDLTARWMPGCCHNSSRKRALGIDNAVENG